MMASTYDSLIAAIQLNDLVSIRKLKNCPPMLGQSDLLHYAAQLGNPEVASKMLDSIWIGELNKFDDMSFTPLMWAARSEHDSVVRLLLEAGADVNAFDEARCGNTVLREVVETASVDLIQLLLNAGADPLIPGWMGLSAVDKAEERDENEQSTEARHVLRLLRKTKHCE
ncbi:MAG: ankyrin repeat domain-containing protein [Verrucomicrobiota bacterium]